MSIVTIVLAHVLIWLIHSWRDHVISILKVMGGHVPYEFMIIEPHN